MVGLVERFMVYKDKDDATLHDSIFQPQTQPPYMANKLVVDWLKTRSGAF